MWNEGQKFQAGLSWKRIVSPLGCGKRLQTKATPCQDLLNLIFPFFQGQLSLPQWTIYKNTYFTKTKNLNPACKSQYENIEHIEQSKGSFNMNREAVVLKKVTVLLIWKQL